MEAKRGMGGFELMREFELIAECALENEEYMDAALELAGELMNRGLIGAAGLGRFVRYLDARASTARIPEATH